MNRHSYRAYYEYKLTHAEPMRSRKDECEIAGMLSRFPEELPYFLDDQDATVAIVSEVKPEGRSNSIVVVIVTKLDDAATEVAVKECLDGLGLYADKIGQT